MYDHDRMKLVPVILSGGAGTRLWPMSRELMPKQLLALTGERTMLQETAARLAGLPGFALVAGRYEGIDQRVSDALIDEELSIGDYVLSGGEFPALIVIDAVARLLPGALGDAASAAEDSFGDGLLDWPHYTRPEVWDGRPVPPVLLGGNHAAIRRWRMTQALGRTWQRRPDLLARRRLTADERAMLEEYCKAAGVEPPR